MGKLPLLMLLLLVCLTSSLARRYTNPDPQRGFQQCMQRCEDQQEHGTGGSKGQHDCDHQCRKWLGDDDNQGRECEMVCEKQGSEPWKCKRSCKDIELGDKDLQHFAKCQQKCIRRCVQESHTQSQRRGGSIIELVQLNNVE